MQQSTNSDQIFTSIRRKLASVVGFGQINHHTGKHHAQTSWNEGDDQKDRTRIFQHFGLKTKAPKGTKCLGICSGNRESIVIISTDNDIPLEIVEGESILYSQKDQKTAAHIHVKADGSINIDSSKMSIKSNNISILNRGDDDLFKLIIDCLESIASSKVATPNGPQPLLPYATAFNLLSTRMKSFIDYQEPTSQKRFNQ